MHPHRIGGWIAALLLLGSAGQVRADFISDTLGTAGPGNYAILSINNAGNTDVALTGPGTTTGNVGILTGKLSLSGSAGPSIVGNVLLGNTATVDKPAEVQGSVLTNQSGVLTQARTDAVNASSTFAGLAPTPGLPGGNITNTTTVNAANPGGLNVLNISGINLGNNETLTLNGPAGTQFVINNSGDLTLNMGKINLTGGLTPSDVVLNFTDPSATLKTSGGLNNESVVNGIILAAGADTTLDFSPGLVNGEVIIGGDHAHFVSGAEVNGTPPTPPQAVPAPSSMILMGLGGLVFAGLVLRPRRRVALAA